LIKTVPRWFLYWTAGSYVLLLFTSIANTITAQRKKLVHLLTFLLSLGPSALVLFKILQGPAMSLTATGKKRLGPAGEIQALYDIGLVVIGSAALFGAALILNLAVEDFEEVAESKKASKKKNE
jgi:hypothetical protein